MGRTSSVIQLLREASEGPVCPSIASVDVSVIVCPLCRCDDVEVLTDLSLVLCKCRKCRTAFTIAAPSEKSN
jgi:hypothetical protein